VIITGGNTGMVSNAQLLSLYVWSKLHDAQSPACDFSAVIRSLGS
jgi:hypothetical protein